MKSVLNIHWKDWCWNWSSNTSATWYKELLLLLLLSLFSCVWLCATPWTAARQASSPLPACKVTQTHVDRVGDAIQISHSLSNLSAPTFSLSQIRVFSTVSVLRIRWPKYWHFTFNISPSNEYSGLISFRIDWLDLLAVQGTLKSLLQHHSSKASIL